MSLLVVGTLAFDSVKTPFGERHDALGGSATFLSIAASYFAPVRLVGVIGDDFPQEHLDFFRSRNIALDGVAKLRGKTFRWRGQYDDNLNVAQTLETQLNVLEQFDPKVPAHFRDSRYVVLGNFDPTLQRRILDQMNAPALVACDTMNFWIKNTPAELRETLCRVHLLCVNDQEARLLSGEYNLVKAAAAIRKLGPRVLIIKRGEHGALLFDDGGIFIAPAYPLETIFDPTGAGDSFAGGLLGYVARCGELSPPRIRQAIVMGSVLASFAVEDFSLDRFRRLTHQEIRRRFESFKALTHFDEQAVAWGN